MERSHPIYEAGVSKEEANLEKLKAETAYRRANMTGKKWNHKKYQYHKGIPIPRVYK